MSKPKHHHFTTFKVPFEERTIKEPHLGDANILGDWNRIAENSQVTINGETISAILEKQKAPFFKDKAALKDFLQEHLLKHLNEKEKASAIKYVMKAVHQGGLLNPVSTGVSMLLPRLTDGQYNIATSIMSELALRRSTNFVATKTGFLSQEKAEVLKLFNNQDPENPLGPDLDQKAVFTVTATLDVNFSQAQGKDFKPDIQVKNQAISYGNEMIKNMLDKRNFLEKIVDYIAEMFGYRQIENLASKEEKLPLSKKT